MVAPRYDLSTKWLDAQARRKDKKSGEAMSPDVKCVS